MYDELGYLHVFHEDIRHQNILRAPTSPSVFPSLPSPYTQRAYNWRIIDFEGSKRPAAPAKDVNKVTRSWLLRLMESLREGFTIEPWEI